MRRLARIFGSRASGNGASPFLAPTSLMPKDDMRAALRALCDRGGRLFYIFTGGLSFRYNYAGQFADAFPDMIDGSALQVRYFGNWDHTFSDPQAQSELGRLIEGWLRETWPLGATQPAAARS